jgi:hypothetical protein
MLDYRDLDSSQREQREPAPVPRARTPIALGRVGVLEPNRRALSEKPRRQGCCARVFAWLFRE